MQISTVAGIEVRKFHGLPIQTPWGSSQTQNSFGDDCIFHTTSSHGGFQVTGEAMVRVNAILAPGFVPYASRDYGRASKHEWFEEDCDANLVVAALPERFTMDEVERAKKAIKSNARYFGQVRI